MNPLIEALPGALGNGVVIILSARALAMWCVKHFMYICRPSEILVFSGRQNVLADGRKVGFRVVFGGRAFRMPLLETVERMDVSLITVPMTVNGAYSEGGIPLNMHAIANVKVSSNPKLRGQRDRALPGSRPQPRSDAWPRRPWKVTCAACWPP